MNLRLVTNFIHVFDTKTLNWNFLAVKCAIFLYFPENRVSTEVSSKEKKLNLFIRVVKQLGRISSVSACSQYSLGRAFLTVQGCKDEGYKRHNALFTLPRSLLKHQRSY